MACRLGCGGCCVSISISSPLPGLPHGKPAGERCLHLTEENHCRLWGSDQFPDVCRNFQPQREYCGDTRDEAFARLAELERGTTPVSGPAYRAR